MLKSYVRPMLGTQAWRASNVPPERIVGDRLSSQAAPAAGARGWKFYAAR